MNEALREISERIAAGFEAARESIPVILADPRAYPREAMLLAVIAGLALIFLIALVMVIVDAVAGWVRARKAGVRVRRRMKPAALLLSLGALVILLGLLTQAPILPITGPACGACHAMDAAVSDWRAGPHASTGCFGCHAAPGVLGRVEGSIAEVARWTRSAGEGRDHVAYSAACLRCHDDVREGVTGTRVRIQHADLIEHGLECVGCHPNVGHPRKELPTALIARNPMTTCLICHDGERASAECGTCHYGRPSDLAKEPAAGVTRISGGCSACHSGSKGSTCFDCHGLVLPHPDDFLRVHARTSARNPSLCTKCHEAATPTLACACHQDGQTHGSVSEWYALHGVRAAANGPGGCLCHDDTGFRMCMKCHDASPW